MLNASFDPTNSTSDVTSLFNLSAWSCSGPTNHILIEGLFFCIYFMSILKTTVVFPTPAPPKTYVINSVTFLSEFVLSNDTINENNSGFIKEAYADLTANSWV